MDDAADASAAAAAAWTNHQALPTDEWAGLEDSTGVKNYILQAIEEALSDAPQPRLEDLDESDPTKIFIVRKVNDTVTKMLDRMKLVKDGLVEHQVLSRIIYGLALTFPVPLLIARGTSSADKDDGKSVEPSQQELIRTVMVMALCFAIFTASYCYLLVYHFVRTTAPRVSTTYSRMTAVLLGFVSSVWFAVVTLIAPSSYYHWWFWIITGAFIALNWVQTIVTGVLGHVTEKKIIEF